MRSKGKPGPKSVDPASRGTNPANTSGGFPGRSQPQKPIPGPTSTGGPSSIKRALAKKSTRDKGTSSPGLVR
jgi:hypothetical protein